jgi:Tfp pilus assembly protein PilX
LIPPFIAEINMNQIFLKKRKGIALLNTLLFMSLILFLALYFINFSITENRISESQITGMKTYYLAEAGVSQMIWKLKNDATYKNSFETNPTWTANFTSNNPFGTNSGSYTVSIANTGLAHGDIISTGSFNINGKTSQRVIKTKVFKAMGQITSAGNSVYADGNIDISSSVVNYNNGSSHSNGNYIVNGNTDLYIEDNLEATGNYNSNWQADVIVGGAIYAANYPNGAAAVIEMPAVDFNSGAPASMKNMASIIYTENEFENLINSNSTLTLNDPIIYVSGDVEIEKTINLTINGLLVVQGNFEVDSNNNKTINLTINHAAGSPAGIMAMDKIEFDETKGDININGVIYANNQVNITNITSSSANFTVTGGIIGRKVTITSCSRPININYEGTAILDSFFETEFSPVITVEYWEEEY